MSKRPGSPTTAAAAVGSAGSLAKVSPARLAAAAILEEVGATNAHSDDLLHGPALRRLSQVDRDLATALVLGVLRWQIELDARIRPLLSRPDLKLAPAVEIVLRLGAFQILHLERIPVHAALNESVETVRSAGHPHAAGMVNAVLRKLVNTPAPRQTLVETTAALAERLGHPLWLAERWNAAYGRPAAEAICTFDQRQPPCPALFGPAEGDLPFPPMDAGSRLVAELAAASRPDARRVWDCCAAPGGKTMVMARRLPQADLLATDLSPARLKRMAERLAREAPQARIQMEAGDAATGLGPARGGEGFDLILCDVPCSGTGTLARNPEIRHRLQPGDLRRQAERQLRILGGSSKRLREGGRLLYSTCSLEREENEAVVETLLAGGTALKLVPVGPILQDMRERGLLLASPETLSKLTRADCLRTLPGYSFEGDGFFAALLERV